MPATKNKSWQLGFLLATLFFFSSAYLLFRSPVIVPIALAITLILAINAYLSRHSEISRTTPLEAALARALSVTRLLKFATICIFLLSFTLLGFAILFTWLTSGKRLPRPAPPPGAVTVPIEEKNYTKVKVFYATDRAATGSRIPANFYSGNRGDDAIRFGICKVSIPRDHRMGHLESPSIWRLEFREDPEKHVVLLRVKERTRARFFDDLASRVAASVQKEAFVFVHGFNVTFQDAARRTAQLAYDLGFDGAPILYSWPSRGDVGGYAADEESVGWTSPHLKEFLEEVAFKSGARVVHLIAHSMGSRAVTYALNSMVVEPVGVQMPMFQQVVLAAPDIDTGRFKQLAQTIQKTAERVTLYASTSDKALQLSLRLHYYPRAGLSGKDITIIDGIDTIDASTVDTELLGHSYYGDNKSVISDMFWLLREGSPPSSRFGLEALMYAGKTYWAFRP